MKTWSFVTALLFTATVAFGAATVEQKTQVKFGGVMGGVINVFGGKATHEGITTTTSVKGSKRVNRSGEGAELVDLDEEKVYRIDHKRKTYTVQTFDEIRKQFEDAQKQAAEREQGSKREKSDAPEWEVDVDVKETGEKQSINGFDARRVILTITAHEKGKKLEQSGGAVLTNDMWMAPKIAAYNEVAEFERKYAQALYGDLLSGSQGQQMAVLVAMNPAFQKVMKAMGSKKLDGTAVKTVMTLETVAAPGQARESASDTSVAGAVVGGLLGKMKKRQEGDKPASAAGRNRTFESTHELLSASGTASSDELVIPAAYKQRK